VRLVSTVAKTLLTGFLLVCAGFNANGQGDGAHAPSVLPTLKDIFRNLFLRNPSAVGTAVQIAVVAGEISLTANSFTLNGEAILEQSGPAATVRPPLTISRVLSTIANGIHRLAQKLSQAWPLGKEAIIQKMNSLISLADEIADKDNTFNEKAKTSDGYLAIAERIKTLAAKNADYKTELNAETAASLKTEIDTWKKDRTKNGNGGKTNEEILMKTRSLFNNGAANNPNASKTYAIVNNIEKELDSIHSAGLK